MATTTLCRGSIGLALGLTLAATAGCAVVGVVADGLSDERPPGVTRVPPGRMSSGPDSVPGARDVAGALFGGDVDASPARGVSSGYIVSPALTWGALRLHRPHALTGSLFNRSDLRGVGCRATTVPFEVSALPGSSSAEDLTRSGPAWVGAGGPVVRIDTALSLDREVVADRAMRSGALLVQQGPVCGRALFVYVRFGVGDRDAVAAHW